jgi:hypothetical protein
MSEFKLKALRDYAKQMEQGNPLQEGLHSFKGYGPADVPLHARDFAGEALADQVLRNTGIPVPGEGSSRAKVEDFLNQLLKETHPELHDPNVNIEKMGYANGSYFPGDDKIRLDDDMVKKDGLRKTVATTLHEGAHKFDNKMLDFDGSNSVKYQDLKNNVPNGRLLSDLDPMHQYDLMSKNHHAKIPNLRDADSFEHGALKSLMKSGTFRQIAGALPLIGGIAAASMSGDASAAVPLLDEADDIGESKDDEAMLMGESKGFNNYQKSPAAQARRDALKKLGSE